MTFITTMKEIKHRKWCIKNKSLGFVFVKTDPQSYQMFKSNRKLPCLQYAPSPKCCVTLFMANFITFFSYLSMYYSTWDRYPISFSIFTKFLCAFVFLSLWRHVRHVSGIPRSLSLCFSFLHFCPCAQVLGTTCSHTVWWCIVRSLPPSCCEGGLLISTGTAVFTGSLTTLFEEKVRKATHLHTITSDYPFL